MSNAGGSANIGINLNTADLQRAIAQIVAEANAAIQRVNANAPTISPSQLVIPNLPQNTGQSPALLQQQQAAFLRQLPALLSTQFAQLTGVSTKASGLFPSKVGLGGTLGGALGGQPGGPFGNQPFNMAGLFSALGLSPSQVNQLPNLGNVASKNLNNPGRQFIGDNDPKELALERVGAKQLEAAILEEIAKRKLLSDAYTQAIVSVKRETAITDAAVAEKLSKDKNYIKAKQDSAAALAIEEAAISKGLVGNTEYTDAKTSSAKSAAKEAAIIQQNLAKDTAYIKAKQDSAIAHAKEAALIQQGLAGNLSYLKSKQDLAIAQVQEQRNLTNRLGGQQNLASSRQYVTEKTSLAVAQARQEAAINQSLAGEQAYTSSKSALAASQARLAASINQAMVTDGAYLASKADLVISQEALSVALKAELLNSANQGTYIQLKASNATLLAQEKAALAQTLAGNNTYIQAKAEVAVAAKAEAAAIARAIQNDPLLRASSVFSATDSSESNASRKRQETAALLRSPTYAADTGQERADRVRLTTQENIAKLQSIQGDTALAGQKRTELRLKDQILLEELQTFTQVDAAKKAQITLERQRIANLTRITELEFLQSAQGQASLRERARRLILEREYNKALQRELAAELRESGRPFAALTTRFGGGGFGGGASGGTGAAGFFGSGLLSTLKYSIPSALLFGAVAGIGSTIKEAEELNKTLSLLQAQLDATGKSGDFEGLREEILSISKETGIAADNVAKFAVQLQGAFGRNIEIEGLSGTDLVKQQIEGVSKLDALLELDDKQVIDTTVAVGRQFGVLAEQIGNVAFQAQQFGVPAEELQVFLADIAPVAKDAGFELEQIASIGAAAILNSGKSASSIAEAFGRVIPAVTKAKTELLSLSVSEQALNTDIFTSAVASGDVATILTEIGTNLDRISGTSKDFVVQLLGGRREAQAILAAFSDPKLLEDFGFDKNNADAQTAAYARLQATLGQTLKELSQTLQQLGIALLDAGLADALKLVAELLKSISSIAGGLLKTFASLNESLGGLPIKLLAVYGVYRLFSSGAVNIPIQTFANRIQPPGPGVPGYIAPLGPGGLPQRGNQSVYGPPSPAAPGRQFANTAAVAVAAGAVLAVPQSYQSTQAGLEGAETSLREQLKTVSRERLEEIAAGTNTFFEGLAGNVFGVDLPNELAQAEIILQDYTVNKEFFSALSPDINSAAGQLSQSFTEDFLSKYGDAFNQYLADNPDIVAGAFSPDNVKATIPSGPGRSIAADAETAADVETLKALAQQADANNEDAQQVLTALIELIPERDVELRNLIESIISGSTPEQEAAKTALDEETLALAEAELLFSAGRIGAATYESSLKKYTEASKRAYDASVAEGDPDFNLLKGYLDQEAKTQEIVVNRLKATSESFVELKSIGATGSEVAQAELDAAITALNDPELTNVRGISEFADAALEAQQALFDAQLDNFETGVEKLAFLNSNAAQIDPFVLAKIIESQLDENNAVWIQILEAYAGFFDSVLGSTTRAVLSAGIAGTATIEEVRNQLKVTIGTLQFSGEGDAALEIVGILQRIDQAIAFGVDEKTAIANALGLATPNTSLATSEDFTEAAKQAEQDAEKAKQEAERQREEAERAAEEARQAAIDLQNAQFEYYKILAGGDSLAVANISIDQARFALANAATPAEWQQATNQLAQAERERKEAEDAIVEARFSYAEVLAGDSAIGAAKIAQQRAAKAMQDAEGVAEELEALAQQFSADRAFELAIRSIFDAQANVVAAMAGYLDDSVASANVGLALAERQYQEALKDYNAGLDEGGEKLLGAQANLINAQATARDAELQGKLDELSVQFEFEKISKNQYIQYLKALKQMPDITKKQVLEIDRQIKQLSGELQQDLQFNLPTNLDLPTLYEVRRSIGSSSSGSLATNGGGYNDNRNVNVVINVNNDADRAFVTQVLEDNLGGPPRSGTAGRFY